MCLRCKLRVARSGNRKQGEEPSGKRKKHAKKDADNAAEKKDSSHHGEGPKTNPPLPIQTNPPLPTQTNSALPIDNCSQETSDTGSHLLPPDAAELEMELRSVLMENGMYDDGWFYQEQFYN
ncbi:hypothetical protein MRB53_020483 [Persea americana]|uniref:Uncharacterized protein n=1 Tax=Persea americana TaxID=3435 RepID=A0ACC2L0X5_PERAE|nr:hypothetical protein MRB53_020483 [Persea americana]